MLTTIPLMTGLIDSGQLRALAVTSKVGSPTNPNVPGVAERGWPDYEARAWYGLVVPKGRRRAPWRPCAGGGGRRDQPADGEFSARHRRRHAGNRSEEFAPFMREGNGSAGRKIVKTANMAIN